jgi:hypothetical protein
MLCPAHPTLLSTAVHRYPLPDGRRTDAGYSAGASSSPVTHLWFVMVVPSAVVMSTM